MNKFSKFIVSISLGAALFFTTLAGTTGCATKQVVTPATATASATTNTVVNQANLAIDTLVIQNVVSLGLPILIQKDPSVLPELKDASLALNLVLNGATTNTLNQVLAALGKSSNTNLSMTIAPYITVVNSEQQALLTKYGAGVAGQITLAIATAFNNGLTTALVGH